MARSFGRGLDIQRDAVVLGVDRIGDAPDFLLAQIDRHLGVVAALLDLDAVEELRR